MPIYNGAGVPRVRFAQRGRSRGLAVSVAALMLAGLSAHDAAAAQTKSYVVSWLTLASYSQEGDCPGGIEPVAEPGRGPVDTMYRKILVQAGKTPQEVEDLMKEFNGGGLGPRLSEAIVNRGRIDGKPVNVYQNPESFPDPNIGTVTSKYVIGFNLDGKGADSPTGLEDPETHEKGIDNQYFRAVGCIGSSRAVPPDRPTHWGYTWRLHAETSPAWLISITGEDLSKDGDVTVTFDKAIERMRLDANADVRRDMTFRVDPNPRTHVDFKGRIKDGVLTIDPGYFKMVGDTFIVTDFDIVNTHLRLKLKPDGSLEGLLGGYQTWAPIYFYYGSSGSTHENMFGLNMPGIYYALKKLADADPDPKTGQNTRISVAYKVEAVPAFVVPQQQIADKNAIKTPKAERSRRSTTGEPASTGGEPVVRRITANAYRRIITDVFGAGINVSGRFEPDLRTGPVGGLYAVGSGRVSVTATGLEQYDGTARAIAAKVVDEQNRNLLIPCKPKSLTEPDDACASQFLSAAGRLLYRRPLTQQELQAQVAAAATTTKTLKSFYAGIELSLAGMMKSLPFLFRDETAEPDPAHPGQYRLDAFSKASRLSFLLWDAAPDPELLAAAESGELNTEKGLARQVDRLLASPRVGDGVRAFFTDMLGLEDFSTISKDAAIYPKYSAEITKEAPEQTLRTIVDHVVTRQGDYRELFTTRRTFLTPLLSSVYGVPMATDVPLGALDEWQAYEYPEGDQRGGILTQVSFVSLHSHPGRSSPTLRGKALREILLCQKVPDPPANVNFSEVENANNPVHKTARERLKAHATEAMCTGCHKVTDPMGLALENFDSAGGYRAVENGAPIDTSGSLDGKAFANALGLGQAVHDHPATTSCLVDKLYAYAAGRLATKGEAEWVQYLKKSFAADGYRIPALLRRIATSNAYYRVAAPQSAALETTPAIKLAQENAK
jgi:hypothetical protein